MTSMPLNTSANLASSLQADFAAMQDWVVVGVSQDQSKYGNKIFRDLRAAGYRAYPVHPTLATIEGQACYESLKSLLSAHSKLDPARLVVDFVVPPAISEQVVDDCIALGFTNLWFQPGSESETAIAKAQAAGLKVVSNACIMIQKRDWR